ncbi:B-cell linker protein isoform X3 [Lepisosteus oculatus]|uniref:B-cell linker protein isoform X3 n=1 Tax=Lepisosteus oculatus TaxID=7918 RepID=UPI00073FBA5E|nr:PREDICTED: B-cell linker protein isoform X3 [Lepisosteus oculatus]
MALNLPTKEQVESWRPHQLVDFLSKNGMRECSLTVEKMKIDGHWFLNLSDSDLNKFNFILQPQLQKMVQDIKKNDGGIMNKFKKITNKPPPTVPRRDYPDEDDEDEQWSETEFDSDYENADDHSETYEVPLEDNDDSYEPPPCEKEKRNITSVSSLSKGDYADKRTESSRLPPRKPVPSIPRPQQPVSPQKPPKPQLLVKPQKPEQDDADYICPKEDGEDDNYIEPSEKSSVQDPPAVNRDTKPTIKRSPPPGGTHEPTELYEVPDLEVIPSAFSRVNAPTPPKAQPRSAGRDGPLPISPRPPIKKLPAASEPVDEDEYEVCDPDNSESSLKSQPSTLHSLKTPAPLPREGKKPILPVKPEDQSSGSLPRKDTDEARKPVMNWEGDVKARPTAMKHNNLNTATDLPPPAARAKPQLSKGMSTTPPKLPSTVARGSLPRNGPTAAEQEAGVYSKSWYASTSERKVAEDALMKTNKDGSFLIRKSSGHDAKQPYTLVVFYKKKVYNIPVRYIESSKQYALGREKAGEEWFSSVADMIENHQHNPLVLIDSQNNTKDSTKLKYPVKV